MLIHMIETAIGELEWLFGLVMQGKVFTAIGYVLLSLLVVLVLVNIQRARMQDP